MDQKEFLARVLPPGRHHYIAFPTGTKLDNGRPVIGHSDFIAPDAGVAIATREANRNHDVWFALAGFKQAKILDPKLGKEKSYRKQENVAELKSLFLDLDFKAYDSPDQTIHAFVDFLEASQLEPPSIIVNTGGGLHIYWTFPKAIPLAEWQPLANGLAGIAENLGLKADLQCTIDSARILRMPGTRNLKYDPARLVEIIVARDDVDPATLAKKLHGVTSMRARSARGPKVIPFTVDPAVLAMFPADSDDLTRGVNERRNKLAIAAEPGGCPMLGDMLARGGDGDSRELWNNMLLLAAFAEDGRGMAHKLSAGDARYTPHETDQELDMKLADVGAGKLGPTLCTTFAACSNLCQTCPHWGKITTPLVLGKPVEETVLPLRAGAPTYVKNGATWAAVDSDPPVEFMLFDMALDRPVLLDLPGGAKLELTFRGGGRVRVVTLTCGEIPGRDYLAKTFFANSMPVPKPAQKVLEAALVSWTNLLRNENIGADAPAFGWSDHGFSLNGDLYTPSGEVKRVGIAHENVATSYAVKGDPVVWQDLATTLIQDPRTELQVLLATAFAAPLIEFTELPATWLVIRSPNSGVGKTSAMKIARAVYGDPVDMAQANDTPMAVETKFATLTNMPWYWDEVKIGDAKKMSDMGYQMMQGKSKARGRPDGSLRSVHKIHGMLVMAMNLNMTSMMQEAGKGTDAGGYRVFQVELSTRPSRAIDPRFSSRMGKLGSNHGHAGVAYAAYLAANQAKAVAVVDMISDQVDKGMSPTEAERYWITTIKVLLAGACLAKDAGICPFDVPRMFTHLKGVLDQIRNVSVSNNSPAELAARIWRFYANRSLITDEYHLSSGPGKPKVVRSDKVYDVHRYGAPRVRLAYITNDLLLSKEGVREFAERYNDEPELYFTSLERITKSGAAERTSIDKGVDDMGSRSGRELVYILDAEKILGVDEVQQWVTSAGAQSSATPGSSSGSGPSGSTAP